MKAFKVISAVSMLAIMPALTDLPVFGQVESGSGAIAGYIPDNWFDISIDRSVIETLSAIEPGKNDSYQFAFPVKVEITPESHGSWKRSGDFSVWTVGIRSKGALSLNLILEPFNPPPEAFFFLYNGDRSVIRGPFGSINHNKSGILPVAPLPGEELILEYHVPYGKYRKGTFGISQAAHDYRGIFGITTKDERFNRSQFCNVDINCEAGAAWAVEKRAVCRIIIRGSELCTGFLVNNTNQQNRALLITAQHCIVDDYDAARSVFVFGYESPWCDGPDGRVIHSISGSALRSSYEPVDFSLVELSVFPPYTYKPYLAGWDVTGAIPQRSVTIHHPEGDVKKITTDQNQPVTATFTGYKENGFWKVLQWESGTTEGGSSGAPLFDQNRRAVGILTGGEAVCGRSVNDYFAKLSTAYNLSGLLWEQLKGWLDPGLTGTKILSGRDPYESNLTTLDTLSNFMPGDIPQITPYLSPGSGYSTGFNSDSLVMYAEYFTNPPGRHISEVLINISKAASASPADSARIFLFQDGPEPGIIIASVKIFLAEAMDNRILKADFKNTLQAAGNFFIGWKIHYKLNASAETRQLAVYHSPPRASADDNTAWFNEGAGWKRFTLHPSFPASVSLDVKVVTIGNPAVSGIDRTPDSPGEFMVYPRPAGNWILLSSAADSRIVLVEVADFRGRIIHSEEFISAFPGEVRINTEKIPQGIYILRIIKGRSAETHKIIISR